MVKYANILLKILIIGFGSLAVIIPDWPAFVGKTMVLRFVVYSNLVLIIPLIWFAKGKKTPYPHFPDFVFGFPLLLDLAGNYSYLFWTNWYDKFLHCVVIVIFGFFLLSLLFAIDKKSSRLLIALAAMGILSASHILWEIFEYYLQYSFGQNLYLSYADTMGDFTAAFIGSLVVFSLPFFGLWSGKWMRENFVEPLSALFR